MNKEPTPSADPKPVSDELENKERECNCCGWDDHGHRCEPNCASLQKPSPLTGEEELSKVLREMDEVWKEWIETSNPAALANWNCYALEVVPALRAKNKELTDKLKTAQEALEKLSRLGNGDRLGNSDGNVIAQEALASIRSSPSV